jgi:hypothetical protein
MFAVYLRKYGPWHMDNVYFMVKSCVFASLSGKEAAAKVIQFFRNTITECRENYDENNIRSFVDQCIKADYDDEEILIHLQSYWGDATDSVPGAMRLWVHLMGKYTYTGLFQMAGFISTAAVHPRQNPVTGCTATVHTTI